jgi:arginase
VSEAIAELLRARQRPLVVGGCCSFLPGLFDGVRRAGIEPVVVYLDGHTDMYEPQRSATGEAADVPLGLALGTGGPAVREAVGDRLLDPAHVWLVGSRDDDEWAGLGSAPPADLAPGLHVVDAPALACWDAQALGERIAAASDRPLWLHVDLDVLDGDVMPAVTYPQPDGPGWETVEALATAVARSGRLIGIDVTDLDADADPGGAHAAATVDFLERVLAAAP